MAIFDTGLSTDNFSACRFWYTDLQTHVLFCWILPKIHEKSDTKFCNSPYFPLFSIEIMQKLTLFKKQTCLFWKKSFKCGTLGVFRVSESKVIVKFKKKSCIILVDKNCAKKVHINKTCLEVMLFETDFNKLPV